MCSLASGCLCAFSEGLQEGGGELCAQCSSAASAASKSSIKDAALRAALLLARNRALCTEMRRRRLVTGRYFAIEAWSKGLRNASPSKDVALRYMHVMRSRDIIMLESRTERLGRKVRFFVQGGDFCSVHYLNYLNDTTVGQLSLSSG